MHANYSVTYLIIPHFSAYIEFDTLPSIVWQFGGAHTLYFSHYVYTHAQNLTFVIVVLIDAVILLFLFFGLCISFDNNWCCHKSCFSVLLLMLRRNSVNKGYLPS